MNIATANPLLVALVDALRTHAGLQTILHTNTGTSAPPNAEGRVFDESSVPAGLVGRWVTIGDTSEAWAKVFMGGSSTLVVMLHVWHTPVEGEDVGKATALDVWGALALALGGTLTLSPTLEARGAPVLVGMVKDADGQSWHGPVRYEVRTRAIP